MKGQIEGIGTRPRLVAKDIKGETLVDATWPAAEVSHVPAALDKVIAFLREQIGGRLPTAIGHRVVHGGPDYSEPTIVSDAVIDRLETLRSARASPPAQQPCPNPRDLGATTAPAAGCLLRYGLPQRPSGGRRSLCDPREPLCRRGCVATDFTASPTSTSRGAWARSRPKLPRAGSWSRISAAAHPCARISAGQEPGKHDGLHGARWSAHGHTAGAARRRRCALPHEREGNERESHRALSLQRMRPQGPFGHQQRRERAARELGSAGEAGARLFRLPDRALHRDARGRDGRHRRLRVHGGHRGERTGHSRGRGAARLHGSASSSTPRQMPRTNH